MGLIGTSCLSEGLNFCHSLFGGASAFASDCLAAVESLNVTAFLKGLIMLKSCISAMFIASASPW